MKKIIIYLTLFCFLIITPCFAKASNNNIKNSSNNDFEYNITMKRDLLCIMMAYPEYVENITCEKNGHVYLIMKSGKKILYDDKKSKNFDQKRIVPDLQDSMEQIYPLSNTNRVMDDNFDPGRFRSYDLLKEVYGNSKNKIEKNLKNVHFNYKTYSFNGNNYASVSLQNAINQLMVENKTNTKISHYLFPCSGTFNYRLISGTNRLSPHAFGIAIDLASDPRDYWKWTSKQKGEERLKSYPKEIVEVFENNNFIWGGKWNHFDILHFEYRPEIILKARYFNNVDKNSPWYNGAPYDKTSVKTFIDKIETALN